MELKLNIYDDDMKEVVKTYKTETFDIRTGSVEDLLDLIDVDNFTSVSDAVIIKAALKLVSKGFVSIKDILKTVFKGLSDEEIKNTKMTELVNVIVGIVKYSFVELSQLTTGKNV